MEKFTLKNDKYRKARGGVSRFLDVYCAKCKTHVLLYQKDAIGPLKRMYMDRIFAPQSLTNLQKGKSVKDVEPLKCSSCKHLIGVPYIYEKETREAFLLDPTSFVKKISKGTYPPKKLHL